MFPSLAALSVTARFKPCMSLKKPIAASSGSFSFGDLSILAFFNQFLISLEAH